MKIHALSLSLVLLLPAAQAVAVAAPSFTLNGSYTLTIETNATVQRIDFALDSGQALHVVSNNQTRFTLTVNGVPDGLRSWNLTLTGKQVQVVRGQFTAQDLTSFIRNQIERSLVSTSATVAASRAAEEAALNASRRLTSILPDLAHRSDVANLASAADARLQGLGEKVQQEFARQAQAVEEAQASLAGLQHSGSFLVVLLFAGLCLLGYYLHRLRDARLSLEDRVYLRALAQHYKITIQDPRFQAALKSLGYEPPRQKVPPRPPAARPAGVRHAK